MDSNLVELVAVAVAAAMANYSQERELWDAKTIGTHMGVGHRQVLERYAPLPDFPKSIRVPVVGGGRGQPLWKPAEIRKWWYGYQAKN